MSDGGDIEVEATILSDVLPKDVVKEVGNVKLFNKWDYDVEVRDISLTYVRFPSSRGAESSRWTRRDEEDLRGTALLMDCWIVTTSPSETRSMSPTLPVDMPLSDSARPTAPSLNV